MKQFLKLIVLLCVVFTSCDGRYRSKDSLKESISEFKFEQQKEDRITYKPKEYFEIVTDTIIKNTTSIKIKNYSLMNQNVVIKDESINAQKIIDYQRAFASDIEIKKYNKIIFKDVIDVTNFKVKSESFWKNATLQHVWVNEERSTIDEINLELSFIDPRTKIYRLYSMIIYENGNTKIKQLENFS